MTVGRIMSKPYDAVLSINNNSGDPKLEGEAAELIWGIWHGTEELTEDNVAFLAKTVGGLSFLKEYAAEMGIDLLATDPNCCSRETLIGWLRDKNSGYPRLLSMLAGHFKGSDISLKVKNPNFPYLSPIEEISYPIPLISINSTLTMKGLNPVKPSLIPVGMRFRQEFISGEDLERAVDYARSIILSSLRFCDVYPTTDGVSCDLAQPVEPDLAVCIEEPTFIRNAFSAPYACGVNLANIDNVVISGNAYEQSVDCDGMRKLVAMAPSPLDEAISDAQADYTTLDDHFRYHLASVRLEMQVIMDGGTRSIKFYQAGEEVAHAEEIPDTGHYDYAVYNNDGKYIGYVTLMVGIHFFDVSGREIAWERPEGFDPIPGVLDIKIKRRQREIRNNPQLELELSIRPQELQIIESLE